MALDGLAILALGIVGAWLGISGRVRYGGRASVFVLLLILLGLYVLFFGWP